MKRPDGFKGNAGLLEDGVIFTEEVEKETPCLWDGKQGAIVQAADCGQWADGDRLLT